jgi:hypothetical protein
MEREWAMLTFDDCLSQCHLTEEALKLKAILKHFIDTHPENPNRP